jgi:hypothetical protein
MPEIFKNLHLAWGSGEGWHLVEDAREVQVPK